jgi:hypothetical protein
MAGMTTPRLIHLIRPLHAYDLSLRFHSSATSHPYQPGTRTSRAYPNPGSHNIGQHESIEDILGTSVRPRELP